MERLTHIGCSLGHEDDVLRRAGRRVVRGFLATSFVTALASAGLCWGVAEARGASVEELTSMEQLPHASLLASEEIGDDIEPSEEGDLPYVVCVGSAGDEVELQSEGCYAGRFEVVLPGAQEVDLEASVMKAVRAGGSKDDALRVPALALIQGKDAEDDLTRVAFAVPDGSYEQMDFSVFGPEGLQCVCGPFQGVDVDTTPPVLLASMEDQPLGEDDLHAACPLKLTLSEDHPCLDREGNPLADVSLRDVGRGGLVTLGTWQLGEDEGTYELVVSPQPNGLPEGRYELHMSAVDALGNRSETVHCSLRVDATAPHVELAVPFDKAHATVDGVVYFDEPVIVPLRIADANMDEAQSVVAGMTLSELMRQVGPVVLRPGMEMSPLHQLLGLAVEPAYAATLTLDEGIHELGELVCARDLVGLQAVWQEVGCTDPSRLVVDQTPPQVQATLGEAPVRLVCDVDTGRVVAFFDAIVDLQFTVTDVGGIEDARLTAPLSAASCELREAEPGSLWAVTLGDRPLTTETAFVVRDRSGNATEWRMGMGTRSAAAGGSWEDGEACLTDDRGRVVGRVADLCMLVTDVQAPTIALTGIADGAHTKEPVSLGLRVHDEYLGYAALGNPGQVVLSVTKDGAPARRVRLADLGTSVDDTDATTRALLGARSSHEDDGRYEVRASFEDASGNRAVTQAASFVIDTRSPRLEVRFLDEDGDDKNASCLSHQRVAELRLWEENLGTDELNASTAPVMVRVAASEGGTPEQVALGSWRKDDATEAYVRVVSFPADGTYELEVLGTDKAGNPLQGVGGTVVDAAGRYASGAFVIDTTPPQVEVRYASGTAEPQTYEAVDYFGKSVALEVRVRDRNLDMGHSSVTDSRGRQVVPSWHVEDVLENGERTYVATLVFDEGDPDAGDGRKTVVAKAQDLAGNVYQSQEATFVVDQTAPYVTSASLGKRPSVLGTPSGQQEQLWFYNRDDGAAASLALEVGDEYLLDAVWVADEDGTYDTSFSGVRGKERARVVIELRDSEADGSGPDTEFDRRARLFVRDIAGNVRIWTIGRDGTVLAERPESGRNASLDGLGVYPLALIRDTTPPVIRLEGPGSGTYHNKQQQVALLVREHNFAHLLSLDPAREVATVVRGNNPSDPEATSWTIRASQLEDEEPYRTFVQACAQDGCYEVVACLVDVAGNVSEVVRCGPFTVDTTAPVIHVSWDNDDVRNARFYRRPRVATVEVVEHNFDPGSMRIETSGQVGPWSSDGDSHVCTVSFLIDATTAHPHFLRVTGKDLAENAAEPFEADEFVIDTVAPEVRFEKRMGEPLAPLDELPTSELTDESAFAGAFMPVVSFSDDANFDEHGLEVRMEARRARGELVTYPRERWQATGKQSMRLDWGDLGLVEEDGVPSYAMDADDVYEVFACATDLAGNTSGMRSVSFSVNRYGSNFFIEEPLDAGYEKDGLRGAVPLATAPSIVVHEVNVSGADPELGVGAHVVTKEYAMATSELPLAPAGSDIGYTLSSSTDASVLNPYEGWSEYVYAIGSRNFGEGSDSDYGDGGQGHYRVDVGSLDKASNHNTTARFWSSEAMRSIQPTDATATIDFTLDEFGPRIEDLDVPASLCLGQAYQASFYLDDDITNGDSVSVFVDGTEVDVYAAGSKRALGVGEPVGEGTYTFLVPARPLFVQRDVEVHVTDYTGLESRAATVRARGFHVSTLVHEASAAVACLVLTCLLRWQRWRHRL